MGRPKLLMPWRDDRVIDRVLSAWTASRVDETLVIVRKDDEALREACLDWPVCVVTAEVDPPDMKASIRLGLDRLNDRSRQDADRCLVAPADLPTITTSLIDELIDRSVLAERVVVPTFGGKRGHPIVIPWRWTSHIAELAENEGMDTLIERSEPLQIEFPQSMRPEDIDTPEEYQQMRPPN